MSSGDKCRLESQLIDRGREKGVQSRIFTTCFVKRFDGMTQGVLVEHGDLEMRQDRCVTPGDLCWSLEVSNSGLKFGIYCLLYAVRDVDGALDERDVKRMSHDF